MCSSESDSPPAIRHHFSTDRLPAASATTVAWLASPSGIAATTRRPQPRARLSAASAASVVGVGGYRPGSCSAAASCSRSAAAARARCEMASFSPASISPTVRDSPSGTNAGS